MTNRTQPAGEELGIHDPSRHEPVAAGVWSDTIAADAIATIVSDFEERCETGTVWPTHPLEDGPRRTLFSAYLGAAGAVQALEILARAGYAAPRLSEHLPEIHRRFLDEPDIRLEAGLQLGEVGILTPAVLAQPDDVELRGMLRAAMARAGAHPAQEITSGGAGAMAAALALFQATGQGLWKDAADRLAEALWKGWQKRADTGSWLWDHEIFGGSRRYFGACHGVAGNAALLANATPERADEALRRAAGALEQGALWDGESANWPVSPDPSGGRRLVQWCHGAAGVVVALGDTAGAEDDTRARLDALLRAGGAMVWKAGPLAKGPGLCHGTAGNGYAFLKLYRRTGDEVWLERARCFAMHGIAQREAQFERFGQGRYTLWTGDGGLAIYLHHCRRPDEAAFPALEVI